MFDRQERRPNPWADQIDDTEPKRDTPDPLARREDRIPKPRPKIETLSASVGDAGTNDRRDVAKVEKMLGDTGDLDLKQTDGPTGYWGMRTSEATKRFQKKNKLKVDGQINAAGPTLKKLGQAVAAKVRQAQAQQRPKPARHPRVSGDQVETLDSRVRGSDKKAERNRPNLSPDAVSANARAARYLASRRGIGDYPTFVADGIEMNPAQGIAEAADLIEQTRAKSPEQANELYKKTLDGLSGTNADRLRRAVDGENPISLDVDAAMQDTDGSETLSMAMIAPASGPAIQATTAAALAGLVAAGVLSQTEADRLLAQSKIPKGSSPEIDPSNRKTDRHGVRRTDIAEPLPDREGFPTHEGDEEDGKLAGDAPAPNTPDREEFLPHDIDNTVPGTPDQSDQMAQGTILEMAKNRERRHLEYLAKKWGMDYHDLSENLHALKEHHGLGGREVEFDVETGDIFDPLSAERLSLGVIKSDNPKRAKGRDNRKRHQKNRH